MQGRTFDQVFRDWQTDPEAFWGRAAEAIRWNRTWDRVLDDSRSPFTRWFPGARLNTCDNAVDRHVEAGHGDRVALIHDSPATGRIGAEAERITWADLLQRVERCAAMLLDEGVATGDRVLLYMPMIPDAVVAMLACARIGAVHSVVFGGFAARELATRIDDARPTLLLTATCGIEAQRIVPYLPLVRQALELADHGPRRVVVRRREEHPEDLHAPLELDWEEALADAPPDSVPCVVVDATDPLYILYTSGTTGVPKGVVRDHGGHAVALAWSMANVYGAEPGDVFWAASDIGWVVGHSYIVYGPLLHGCTTVLYEGKPVGTPDAGAFWRVVEDHGVDLLFTAPTALRAIKREDPDGRVAERHDTGTLRTLFLAGERADPDTIHWARRHLHVPVIDHWWQTETGWPIAANCMGIEELPVKVGSPTRPVPGYAVRVVDDDGRDLPAGTIGSIVVDLPLPPGCLPTLWRNDEGFVSSYMERFPGSYLTGDAGLLDEDGYLFVLSRTDDLINVAGHRLSTGAMEEVLAAHDDVAEAAVLGVADDLKGQLPLGLVVLNVGVRRDPAGIVAELVAAVRREIGPVASFRTAVVVDRLPKTRSGKVLRGTVRKMADGEPFRTPATIEDPAVLDEIRTALARIGYPRNDST